MTPDAAGWPRVACAKGQDPSPETGFPVADLIVVTLDAVWVYEQRSLRLSVYLCGDDEMRRLHARWAGDDSTTDVLSFPLGGDEPGARARGAAQGELVVSVERAREQARAYDNSLLAELALYVVHGALHLLGYDDGDDTSARAMRQAELRVLERLQLAVRGRHDGLGG